MDGKKPMTPDEMRKSDAEMMEAVLAKQRPGWKRISALTLEFLDPKGYGFVTHIRGQWEWIAHPNGQDRKKGSRMLMESAMQDVTNEIHGVSNA